MRTTIIHSHTIEYWWKHNDLDYNEELSETDEEHIIDLLSQNFYSGELCTVPPNNPNTEVYGWWRIKK